jgi:transketolase
MRNTFAETFYKGGSVDPRLCIVVADISPAGSIQKFREDFPDRFVNTGVAEQIMIGMCAGMALRGLRPFAYTIATFALFRPFEMVRDDLCYQNLPVTVVGIGGGVTYSTLGGTHHAQEDVAIATALPNMTVIAPCDPAETIAATEWCMRQSQGPVYLRLGKAGEPDLSSEAPEPWTFGKLRCLKSGSDICILAYGTIMKLARALADDLDQGGKSAALYSAHTLKPLDREGLEVLLRRFSQLIVIEEMSAPSGLRTIAKSIAYEIGAKCKISGFSLQDAFIHNYGSQDQLHAAHGLDLATIKARLGRP